MQSTFNIVIRFENNDKEHRVSKIILYFTALNHPLVAYVILKNNITILAKAICLCLRGDETL